MSASCPQPFGKDLTMFHLDDDHASFGAGRTPTDRSPAPADPCPERVAFPTAAEQTVIDDIFARASRLSAVLSWVVVAVVLGVIAAVLLS